MNEPTQIHRYYPKYRFYSYFLRFYLTVFFCCGIPFELPHSIRVSFGPSRLDSFSGVWVTVSRSTGRLFCRISFNGDVSGFFFLWLDWGYKLWRGKSQSWHAIFTYRVRGVNMTYFCWYWPWSLAEVMFVWFFLCNLARFPPFQTVYSLEEIHVRRNSLCAATARGRVTFPLSEGRVST